MIVVVMGVAGAGKSSVGSALAAALGWPFVEADDLHPPANVAKMGRGEPLDDDDRAPWLEAVAARLRGLQDGVVACSALRARYRDKLRVRPDVRFVLLDVPAALLAERLARRQGHYMPASLLPSQLAALERTEDVIVVDGARPFDAIVAEIRAALAV
ncbi:MAG: gluconate kinase [bacterium]|nr:gluconate kinase [bacterium]